MRGKHAKQESSTIVTKVAVITGLAIGTAAVPILPIAAYAAPVSSTYRGPLDHNTVTQPFHNPGSYGLGYHTGVDLAASNGDNVHSAGPGTVSNVGGAGAAYGNHVIIHHPDGKYTLYAHLSSVSVNTGDTVTADTIIGQAGSTGTSSGPHLHFEVRTDPTAYAEGVFSDPVAWLAGHGVALNGSTAPASHPITPPKKKSAPVKLPVAPATTYTVAPGDTLFKIAVKFHVGDGTDEPWHLLYEANKDVIGDNPNLIFPGQELVIPGSSNAPKRHRNWRTCTDAWNHGWHDFRKESSGYRVSLDKDHDGIACETNRQQHHSSKPGKSVTQVKPAPPVVGGSFTPVIAPDGSGTASGYAAHSPSFWIPLINQAMGLVGGGVAQGNQVQAVVNRITIESGGNPNAINLYDSNAAAGHPSKGLLQTIESTFQNNHLAGTSTNIYDPLANICAALKYINAVYGGIVPSSATY